MEPVIRWKPSRVVGLPMKVGLAAVYPDRLELVGEDSVCRILFTEIARWPAPTALRKTLFAAGVRPRWLPIADRDWFHPPALRFFRFYTEPRIVVHCADEPEDLPYERTLFRRIQDVIRGGGYHTFDLG